MMKIILHESSVSMRKMKCRYCDHFVDKELSIQFGKMPITPNAIEKGILLDEKGNFYEYEFEIVICKNCGLIQQLLSPDPNKLYFRFKNEIVGDKWNRHFTQFVDFICMSIDSKSSLLEVGAGDLKLANMLLKRGFDNITIVEKNIDSDNVNNKIKFHFNFLEEVNFNEKFDLVYSSHVFEHISNIKEHIQKTSEILVGGGKFIFSLPNFKKWIENFNLNAFSQEHPIYPTLPSIENILSQYGLIVIRTLEFEDHSLFIESELRKTKLTNNNTYVENRILVEKYKENFEKFKKFVSQINYKRMYIFGGNSSTQILLKLLKPLSFDIIYILDNANIKENKYLYGFDYLVKKPNILKNESRECVILVFTGSYIEEIKNQIKLINDKIPIITMNDFKSYLNSKN